MTVIKSIALLLVLAISAITAQECTISLLQERRSVWSSDEGTFSLYDVRVHNTGTATVHVTLHIAEQLESAWEIDSLGNNEYSLPDWRAQAGGLLAGAYHQFGYVIKSDAPANIQVIGCDAVIPRPTDAPAAPTDAPVGQPTGAATEAPVEQPTDAATETPVEQATDAPTGAPTAEPTVAPTDAPTAAPTDAPARTQRASRRPSTAPTAEPVRPTADPTAAPSRRPATEKPATERPATAEPTQKPDATTAPTTASKATNKATTPAAGTNGKICGSGTWWRPSPLTTYQWQLTGTLDSTVNVQMYDIDMFDATAATVKKLHDAGRVVICYFSTQFEDWRPDASQFTSAVKGNALDDWEGENYVDIRSPVVRAIMAGRMDLAVSKGCDGIEPDNVDGYSSNTGFPLKAADQLDYNKYLAAEAHKRGLSIGLKNDLAQAKALEPFFDWALNEECYQYGECTDLNVFVTAGKAVFNTEYSGSASKICPYMNGLKFTSLLKDLSLGAKINAQCCTYLNGGCTPSTPAPYTCVSAASSLIAAQEDNVAPEAAHQTQEQLANAAVASFFSATTLLAAIICGLMTV